MSEYTAKACPRCGDLQMWFFHWDDEEKGESGSCWLCESCGYDEEVTHYSGSVYGLPAEIFRTTTTEGQ